MRGDTSANEEFNKAANYDGKHQLNYNLINLDWGGEGMQIDYCDY